MMVLCVSSVRSTYGSLNKKDWPTLTIKEQMWAGEFDHEGT